MTSTTASAAAFVQTMLTQRTQFLKTCNESWRLIDFSLSEPKLINAYLSIPGVGINYLNTKFSAPFSQKQTRFTIKFSSVFIHQRPKVYRYNTVSASPHSKACELGDVCIIYVHVDRQKGIRFARALIAQAKKSDTLDSADQRLLYDEAPGFDYEALAFYSKTYNSDCHRPLPGYHEGRVLGLKYLILDPNLQRAHTFYIPWRRGFHSSWGNSLFSMALGHDGLDFTPRSPEASSWSAILDDLIRMGNKSIPSSSRSKTWRGDDEELKQIVETFNNFRNYDMWSIESDEQEPGGIPLMLMIVQDNELDPNN